MMEENKKKLKNLMRLSCLLAILYFLWPYGKNFIMINNSYIAIIGTAAVFFFYFTCQIALILKSEEGKEVVVKQRTKIIVSVIVTALIIIYGLKKMNLF